jgi:hypothetical protein
MSWKPSRPSIGWNGWGKLGARPSMYLPSLLRTGYAGRCLPPGVTGMVLALRSIGCLLGDRSAIRWPRPLEQTGYNSYTGYTPPHPPPWCRDMPAVEVLRQVWVQQFSLIEGVLRWRQAEGLPPSVLMICSPYDAEARDSKKRSTEWTGYRAHLTETCDENYPHLITDDHRCADHASTRVGFRHAPHYAGSAVSPRGVTG